MTGTYVGARVVVGATVGSFDGRVVGCGVIGVPVGIGVASRVGEGDGGVRGSGVGSLVAMVGG